MKISQYLRVIRVGGYLVITAQWPELCKLNLDILLAAADFPTFFFYFTSFNAFSDSLMQDVVNNILYVV